MFLFGFEYHAFYGLYQVVAYCKREINHCCYLISGAVGRRHVQEREQCFLPLQFNRFTQVDTIYTHINSPRTKSPELPCREISRSSSQQTARNR